MSDFKIVNCCASCKHYKEDIKAYTIGWGEASHICKLYRKITYPYLVCDSFEKKRGINEPRKPDHWTMASHS